MRRGRVGETVLLGENGCVGHLLEANAQQLTSQHIRDECEVIPHFRLAVIDKPKVR